ncbi:PD40 domain-containing protein [Candidatus Poribacteria bacterium]|nr:PD40 domain-containing protein [Candidatus Poribacteria bacterium]
MKPKIGIYRKSFCVSWLCLLMFVVSHIAHAKLKIYYMPTGRWERNLWRMDINGANKELVLESPVPMSWPTLSPDGKQILFTLPPFLKPELMVINLDGSGLRKLLADPPRPFNFNMDGEWSPDGKWIVYEAFDPDLRPSSKVYVTDAQGFNSFQIAPDIEANMSRPFWSPDSKRIGFTVGKRGAKLHWVDADPNAKAKEMNHRFFAHWIRWSPNGKQTIVYGSIEEWGHWDLFLGDAPARNLVLLNDEANLGGAQWLPDNEHIVGTSGVDHHNGVAEVDVVVVNVDTQEVQRLTDDGQSVFVFWHDAALAVEPAGKLSTSWGAIKSEVRDANK